MIGEDKMRIQSIYETIAVVAATSKSYLLAGSLGATVEFYTGYHGLVWLGMIFGAFVIRKTPDGAFSLAGIRRTLWKGCGSVIIAYLGTAVIVAEINRPELAYEILVAAVLAGTSEWILAGLRNPVKTLEITMSLWRRK